MGVYSGPIAAAQRLIAKYGRDATLRRIGTAAPPDPSKPWKPGAYTTDDVAIFGVFLDYKEEEINGTSILRGDQHVLVPAVTPAGVAIAAPSPKLDQIVDSVDGLPWSVEFVKPLMPGPDPVFYDVQVRR